MIQFSKRMPVPIRTRTCRVRMIDNLESTMREMAFAGENITPETLKQHGYNDAVIQRFGTAAVAMARRRSVRRIDHADY